MECRVPVSFRKFCIFLVYLQLHRSMTIYLHIHRFIQCLSSPYEPLLFDVYMYLCVYQVGCSQAKLPPLQLDPTHPFEVSPSVWELQSSPIRKFLSFLCRQIISNWAKQTNKERTKWKKKTTRNEFWEFVWLRIILQEKWRGLILTMFGINCNGIEGGFIMNKKNNRDTSRHLTNLTMSGRTAEFCFSVRIRRFFQLYTCPICTFWLVLLFVTLLPSNK